MRGVLLDALPSPFADIEGDLRIAARLRVPVLVTGGTHEDRDMCARIIHARGDRARGPFVVVSDRNIGTHGDRSAVSSGQALMLRRQFEQARGGTLFIDDVAALTAEAQGQLLFLLEERTRGGDGPITPAGDVRIIAGARRHLDRERAKGVFSEALFYRLNIVHLDLTAPRAAGPNSI
jgi:DNA-binding NtrC family response regulator